MKTNGQIQLYPVLRVALFLIAGIVSGELLYGAVLMAAVSFLPWLQTLLAGLLLKVVILLNACVSFVAALPGASVDGIRIGLLQLLLIYILIFALSVLGHYCRKMIR